MMSEFHRTALWCWAGAGLPWGCLQAVEFLIERSERSRPLGPLLPRFIVSRADSVCSRGWWWMTLKDWCRSLELVSHCSQKAEQVWTGTEESVCTRQWLLTQLLWMETPIRIHIQNRGPPALYSEILSEQWITEPTIRTWDTDVASPVFRYSFIPNGHITLGEQIKTKVHYL